MRLRNWQWCGARKWQWCGAKRQRSRGRARNLTERQAGTASRGSSNKRSSYIWSRRERRPERQEGVTRVAYERCVAPRGRCGATLLRLALLLLLTCAGAAPTAQGMRLAERSQEVDEAQEDATQRAAGWTSVCVRLGAKRCPRDTAAGTIGDTNGKKAACGDGGRSPHLEWQSRRRMRRRLMQGRSGGRTRKKGHGAKGERAASRKLSVNGFGNVQQSEQEKDQAHSRSFQKHPRATADVRGASQDCTCSIPGRPQASAVDVLALSEYGIVF